MVVSVVATSAMVVCGGRRKLPKLLGLTLQLLQPWPLLHLKMWLDCYCGGKYTVVIRVVLSGQDTITMEREEARLDWF